MTKLADFKQAQQLSITDFDELLALLDSEEGPPKTAVGNGICPYVEECETRRRLLPHYRPFVRCHWITWNDVANCPILKKGGRNG